MQRTILYVHQGLAWVVLAGLFLQFYLAGMGLFGAASFEFHRTWGYLLAIPILLLLVLALAGRLGRRLIGLSAPGRPDHCSGDAALTSGQHPVNRGAPCGQCACSYGGERRYRLSGTGKSPGKSINDGSVQLHNIEVLEWR